MKNSHLYQKQVNETHTVRACVKLTSHFSEYQDHCCIFAPIANTTTELKKSAALALMKTAK